ncbi:hypothetical protein V866_003874 [Kwoniella sp. B9012]|uniref:Uncharacterized protein n=1 Tax=Kwoniella europaea PYCC6329 TaxID=1423913 RepID=A0AAX4KI97_9TREE
MFLPTFTSLFPLILLPSVLAGLEGSVKVNFPSTTSATQTTELGDIPKEGGETSIGREKKLEGKQECQVWADEGFNKDIEFTLRTQSAGLAGPKNQGGHLKCTLVDCLIPDGKGECKGERVVPELIL